MAPANLYDATFPTFKKGMMTLKHILTKALDNGGPDAANLPSASLIEDLRPLADHVQICSNIAKKSITRMAGLEMAVWDDDETTLAQLIERCDKTIHLMDTIDQSTIAGLDDNTMELKLGDIFQADMSVKDYALEYGVPAFYFHLSIVYSILRMKGIPLGIADYLEGFLSKYVKK